MNGAMSAAGIVRVDAASVAPQAWRNGGGQTRELLAWPAGSDWRLRISRADIASDGPFSAFPGIERWFAVLQGAGVILTFADAVHQLQAGDAPLRFDGAAAPGCRLLDGATQDLNLMLRHGTGVMRAVQDAQPWQETFAMRGLYTTVAGHWNDGQQNCPVPADTLLWVAASAMNAWTFAPDLGRGARGQKSATGAWWLGFTPED
jgi:environmental stress-induced protein Ves